MPQGHDSNNVLARSLEQGGKPLIVLKEFAALPRGLGFGRGIEVRNIALAYGAMMPKPAPPGK
jgi:hypothetical protein